MKVEILTTPDCSNCSVVIDVTKKPEYLKKYPIFTAPGVVINGKLEFTGVPKKEELLEKLKTINSSQ